MHSLVLTLSISLFSRYWLQGPKAGASEIFVDRLPGMPDNLRNRNEGGYYVSLVAVKSPEAFDELKFLTKLPWLRKLLLRFVNLAKMVFDTVSKIYPNKFTEDISFKVNMCACERVCVCFYNVYKGSYSLLKPPFHKSDRNDRSNALYIVHSPLMFLIEILILKL